MRGPGGFGPVLRPLITPALLEDIRGDKTWVAVDDSHAFVLRSLGEALQNDGGPGCYVSSKAGDVETPRLLKI